MKAVKDQKHKTEKRGVYHVDIPEDIPLGEDNVGSVITRYMVKLGFSVVSGPGWNIDYELKHEILGRKRDKGGAPKGQEQITIRVTIYDVKKKKPKAVWVCDMKVEKQKYKSDPEKIYRSLVARLWDDFEGEVSAGE